MGVSELQWDEYVLATWPEFVGHFPPQADVLKLLQSGGVFFGPFCGWDAEE